MNPLTELCAAISKAGYSDEKSVEVQTRLVNDELFSLAGFLLKPKIVFPAKKDDSHVAIGFGGGIDSYCAFLKACMEFKEVTVVHTDYGHPYSVHERRVFYKLKETYLSIRSTRAHKTTPFTLDVAKLLSLGHNPTVRFREREALLLPKDRRLDLAWKDYIVPARNLVLAALCAEVADRVWIIATGRKDETVGTPDKTSRFYTQASVAFSQFYGRRIKVESPCLSKSKRQVVQEYLDTFGNGWDALKATFSCYTPKLLETPCGVCYACYKRYKLFQSFDQELTFGAHPIDGPNFHAFMEAERKKRG